MERWRWKRRQVQRCQGGGGGGRQQSEQREEETPENFTFIYDSNMVLSFNGGRSKSAIENSGDFSWKLVVGARNPKQKGQSTQDKTLVQGWKENQAEKSGKNAKNADFLETWSRENWRGCVKSTAAWSAAERSEKRKQRLDSKTQNINKPSRNKRNSKKMKSAVLRFAGLHTPPASASQYRPTHENNRGRSWSTRQLKVRSRAGSQVFPCQSFPTLSVVE